MELKLQLKKVDTLFDTKQLAKYISSLSASASEDITRSLRNLAIREKLRCESYKENSPVVRQRQTTQNLSVASLGSKSFVVSDSETETEDSDSDAVLCELSDFEDDDDETNSMFQFTDLDADLPELEIRIGKIPHLDENQTIHIDVGVARQAFTPSKKRRNSLDLRGKENKPTASSQTPTRNKPKKSPGKAKKISHKPKETSPPSSPVSKRRTRGQTPKADKKILRFFSRNFPNGTQTLTKPEPKP